VAIAKPSCLYWGRCRWKQLSNCTEMELCRSSLMNPSDRLYSGFQQCRESLVVSKGLMVLARHWVKLQRQIHFFPLDVQIHSIPKQNVGSWGDRGLQRKEQEVCVRPNSAVLCCRLLAPFCSHRNQSSRIPAKSRQLSRLWPKQLVWPIIFISNLNLYLSQFFNAAIKAKW